MQIKIGNSTYKNELFCYEKSVEVNKTAMHVRTVANTFIKIACN